jgi:glyoxylase I family protein
MEISGLLHATFLVSDLERSRAFYEDVLGLPIDASRPDLGFPGAWYEVGTGQQIHLMHLPNPEAGLERPLHPQGVRRDCKGLKPQQHTQHGGRDRHVALAVDDITELRRRLEQAGISYTLSKSGRRALFCRDPDGNALEFIGRR